MVKWNIFRNAEAEAGSAGIRSDALTSSESRRDEDVSATSAQDVFDRLAASPHADHRLDEELGAIDPRREDFLDFVDAETGMTLLHAASSTGSPLAVEWASQVRSEMFAVDDAEGFVPVGTPREQIDPNARDNAGRTALDILFECATCRLSSLDPARDVEQSRLFVDCLDHLNGMGADFDFLGLDGNRPIHRIIALASRLDHAGQIAAMKQVLRRGVDVEAVNAEGQTPLDMASRMLIAEDPQDQITGARLIRDLVQGGAKWKDEQASAMGLAAVLSGDTGIAADVAQRAPEAIAGEAGRALMERGLIAACETADAAMIKALDAVGVDLEARNEAGETAFTMARDMNAPPVVLETLGQIKREKVALRIQARAAERGATLEVKAETHRRTRSRAGGER